MMSSAVVYHAAKRGLAEAQNTQTRAWREYHSHCGHADLPASLPEEVMIACDHTEAYRTEGAEVAAYRQRAAWRASEPRVRHDSTRIVRDHHLALKMNH